MLIGRILVSAFSVGLMLLGADAIFGQDYPNKPIRIVTSEPGGSSDVAARTIAQGLSGSLGQLIIENRPSGVIPGETVAKAPPDGYTLLAIGSNLWLGSLLEKTPYDPVRDFSPIALATISPNIMVVHPSVPVKSVQELIALAKARPGQLNYGSTSTGSSNHLAAELFKYIANVNIVRIPYKGTAQAVSALIGGEVQLMFPAAAGVAPHVKSGRLRALAVTTAQPSTLAPGLPTVAATVPGYESAGMSGLFAPAKTPATIINRLNREIVRFLHAPESKEQFSKLGVEAVGSSPEEFAAKIKSEMASIDKMIKATGIRLD